MKMVFYDENFKIKIRISFEILMKSMFVAMGEVGRRVVATPCAFHSRSFGCRGWLGKPTGRVLVRAVVFEYSVGGVLHL